MKVNIVFTVLIIFLVSCQKKQNNPDRDLIIPNENNSIAWILNEGLYQQNNGSLSLLNYKNDIITNHFFVSINNRELGDVPNAMISYGSKLYILVTGASTIEVLNKKTGKSIQQITIPNREPRELVAFNGMIYFTTFDGYINSLDTTNYTVKRLVQTGKNPEAISIDKNNLIYVSNTGGLDAPNYDSTISVINPNTNSEISKINLGLNPGKTVIIDNHIYCIRRGNYGSVPNRLVRINLNDFSDKIIFPFQAENLFYLNSQLFILSNNKCFEFNFDSNTLNDSPFFKHTFNTLYDVHFSSTNNEFFVSDANGYTQLGMLIKFDFNGNYINEVQTALIPSDVVFIN